MLGLLRFIIDIENSLEIIFALASFYIMHEGYAYRLN